MKNAEGKLTKMWNLFESLGGSRRYGWCEQTDCGYTFSQRMPDGILVLQCIDECWQLILDGRLAMWFDGKKVYPQKQTECKQCKKVRPSWENQKRTICNKCRNDNDEASPEFAQMYPYL